MLLVINENMGLCLYIYGVMLKIIRKKKLLYIHRQILKTGLFIICISEVTFNLRKFPIYQVQYSNWNISYAYEITMPNCTNFSWTIDNITSKDIQLALITLIKNN